MRKLKELAVVILTAASLMSGLEATLSQEAVAAPACAAELALTVPTDDVAASETPVVLVHGLGSRAATWRESEPGQPSMSTVVESIPSTSVYRFDYGSVNGRWVTDLAIGQKLAKTIVCYSKLYDGKKVVLVAHSMGGLAIREALDWAAYGIFARKVTGHIVTIGTPHEGSSLANLEFDAWMGFCNAQIGIFDLVDDTDELCRQSMSDKATSGLQVDSEQAAKLPKFPEDISVKAIAGDVRGHICVVWGCSEWKSTGGDLVVPIKSATVYYTTTGKGDGKTVFECNTERPVLKITDAWCEHGNMLRAPQVQAEVKRSIEEYLAASQPNQGHPVTLFNRLTLHLPDGVKLQAAHGEGPSSYEVGCAPGATCPKFSVYSPREVGGDLGWREWDWQEACGANVPVRSGVLPIGGRPSRAYKAGHCRFWEMNDGSAFIYSTDPPGGKEAKAFDAILVTAAWK